MANLPLESEQVSFIAKQWGYNFDPSWARHWLALQRKRGGPLVSSTVKKLSKSRTGVEKRDLAVKWVNDMSTFLNTHQIVL